MFDALMSIAWRVTYSISTFTLKNRWAAFVGHTHAASVRFVLQRMVYISILPLVLRLGVHVKRSTSIDMAIRVPRHNLFTSCNVIMELTRRYLFWCIGNGLEEAECFFGALEGRNPNQR